MCQTVAISHKVVQLGKRSYTHRMEIAMPNGYRVGQLTRLNRELDSLYDFIYSQWRTITEEDYRVFGEQFSILIQTVKQLYDTCRKQSKEMGLGKETARLGKNYSALHELNSDIFNFCIKLPKNEEMKQLLGRLSEADNRQSFVS